MSVLVRIEMRDTDSGGLNLANLSAGLRFDLSRIEATRQGTGCKTLQPIAEAGGSRITGSHRGQTNRVQDRLAVNQYDMAAYAETRKLFRQLHSVVEGRSMRHQGRRGHDAMSVSFDDGAVHSSSEPKIIGIDDQTSHGEQSSRDNDSEDCLQTRFARGAGASAARDQANLALVV